MKKTLLWVGFALSVSGVLLIGERETIGPFMPGYSHGLATATASGYFASLGLGMLVLGVVFVIASMLTKNRDR